MQGVWLRDARRCGGMQGDGGGGGVQGDSDYLCVFTQELEQQLQSESETAQEETDHLQSLLDEEKRLKEEACHDVLKTREVRNAGPLLYTSKANISASNGGFYARRSLCLG